MREDPQDSRQVAEELRCTVGTVETHHRHRRALHHRDHAAHRDTGRTGTGVVVAHGDRQHEAIVDEAAGQILATKGNREFRNECAGGDQQERCDGNASGVMDSYYEVEYSDGRPRPPTAR